VTRRAARLEIVRARANAAPPPSRSGTDESLEIAVRALARALQGEGSPPAQSEEHLKTAGADPSTSWLDGHQLSAYLATPINTLLHWRKHGKGPRWHKLGRRVRYARADVDAWIASCAVGKPG